MKKSIYALFFALICCFSLVFSFSISKNDVYATDSAKETNAFRFCRQSDGSGKIVTSYIFPVNSVALEEIGIKAEDIKTYRFYLTNYVYALAKQYMNKETEGVEVSTCIYFTDIDGLGFSITFDSLEAQNKFFGVEDNTEQSEKPANKTSGFFIQKTEIFTTFPFSSSKVASDYRKVCELAILSWCEAEKISNEVQKQVLNVLEDSVFIYDFASKEKKLMSEQIYDDANFHHNIFVKTLQEIEEDNIISFYVTSPNVPVWYMSALVFVITLMFLSYLFLKNRKSETPVAKVKGLK